MVLLLVGVFFFCCWFFLGGWLLFVIVLFGCFCLVLLLCCCWFYCCCFVLLLHCCFCLFCSPVVAVCFRWLFYFATNIVLLTNGTEKNPDSHVEPTKEYLNQLTCKVSYRIITYK